MWIWVLWKLVHGIGPNQRYPWSMETQYVWKYRCNVRGKSWVVKKISSDKVGSTIRLSTAERRALWLLILLPCQTSMERWRSFQNFCFLTNGRNFLQTFERRKKVRHLISLELSSSPPYILSFLYLPYDTTFPKTFSVPFFFSWKNWNLGQRLEMKWTLHTPKKETSDSIKLLFLLRATVQGNEEWKEW